MSSCQNEHYSFRNEITSPCDRNQNYNPRAEEEAFARNPITWPLTSGEAEADNRRPPVAKTNKPNPKDLLGVKKVSITKFPATALAHGAHAMMDGARKYGPFNWRGNAVIASIYIDACMRHLTAWFDGEETASDSGVHHLGHAIACLGILLDAQETGNLIDDRPEGGKLPDLLTRLNKKITEKNASTQS
jgi:hypothetical protein